MQSIRVLPDGSIKMTGGSFSSSSSSFPSPPFPPPSFPTSTGVTHADVIKLTELYDRYVANNDVYQSVKEHAVVETYVDPERLWSIKIVDVYLSAEKFETLIGNNKTTSQCIQDIRTWERAIFYTFCEMEPVYETGMPPAWAEWFTYNFTAILCCAAIDIAYARGKPGIPHQAYDMILLHDKMRNVIGNVISTKSVRSYDKLFSKYMKKDEEEEEKTEK